MKKNRNWLVLLFAILIATAIVKLWALNLEFSMISLQRTYSVEMSYFGSTEESDAKYLESIEEMKAFVSRGDYQQWLYSCGETTFGKFVRFFMWGVEIAVFFVCIGIALISVRNILRKVRLIQRRKRMRHQYQMTIVVSNSKH